MDKQDHPRVDAQRRRLFLAGLQAAAAGAAAPVLLASCGGGGSDGGSDAAFDGALRSGSSRQRAQLAGLPMTYVVSGTSMQSIVSNNTIRKIVNINGKTRPQAFAGPHSTGLLTAAGAACPYSVQFGLPGMAGYVTAVTQENSASGMEAGSDAPARIETDVATGNQWLGDGRVFWNAATRKLRMVQKAGDSLVAHTPRVQLYSHQVPNRTGLRFHCHFQLGDTLTPWPRHVPNRNSTLIFQFKGENTAGSPNNANYPAVTLEVRDNAAGRTDVVDIVLTRRVANQQAEQEVCRVQGLALQVPHEFTIDIYPDWVAGDAPGGHAQLCLWHDSQRVPVNADLQAPGAPRDVLVTPSIYGPETPDLYRGMWGIYRYRYYDVPAPDDACIVWSRAEVQVAPTPMGAL